MIKRNVGAGRMVTRADQARSVLPEFLAVPEDVPDLFGGPNFLVLAQTAVELPPAPPGRDSVYRSFR